MTGEVDKQKVYELFYNFYNLFFIGYIHMLVYF